MPIAMAMTKTNTPGDSVAKSAIAGPGHKPTRPQRCRTVPRGETLDDVRRDAFERIRTPHRIAVLVDDGRADALDEIMFGDAGERDAIVLLKALLDLLE